MNLLGVSKSNSGTLLATGDDMRQVSLLRYPAVFGTKPKRYRGHGKSQNIKKKISSFYPVVGLST